MKHPIFAARKARYAGIFSASLMFLSVSQLVEAKGFERQPSIPAGDGLTVERVSAEPDTDDRSASLQWSPDGARVAWMHWRKIDSSEADQTPQREIWTIQPLAAKPSEKAAQNGAILLSADTITKALVGNGPPRHKRLDGDDDENPFLLRDFSWSKDHSSLLLVGSQSIAWFDIGTGKARTLVSGNDPVSDAAISPDGRTVSFIRGHKLWLVPAQGGAARLLTPAPAAGVLEGEADWAYRNELHMARGYEWSPDSARIAYLETDDRAVAKYTIRTLDGDSREIAYPLPGGKLPLARLFVRSVSGGAAVEMRTGPKDNHYLPRINWLPDSRHLAIQRLDRLQHVLTLVLADSSTGAGTPLLTEKDEYWINLSDILYFFTNGKRFLWSSERTGFRHLYLYDLQGHELKQITLGDWEVTKLNGIDEANDTVYFTSTEKSPLERHLYRVHLDGASQTRISQQTGTHDVFFAPGKVDYVDIYSSAAERPRIALENALVTPDPIASIATDDAGAAASNPAAKSDSAAPRPGMTHHDQAPQREKTAESAQGTGRQFTDSAILSHLEPITFLPIQLHLGSKTSALMVRPPDFDPTRKYPVIVYLAGGPGEQFVRDAWGGATGLWMRLMAEKGFLVFALDNHGTAGRGHYFEEPIHLRLGAQELADQRDGLVYLSSLPYVDMSRLGVCGWGYGGSLVLHAMLDRPVAFKAGFAGAPIADWRIYDATFAERYLDGAVTHADGWLASMAFENDSPKFFKGKLMVAQGGEDEFVHMENAFLIQSEFLKAGRSVDLLLFPDSGHLIEDPRFRLVLFQKMTDFFVMNL